MHHDKPFLYVSAIHSIPAAMCRITSNVGNNGAAAVAGAVARLLEVNPATTAANMTSYILGSATVGALVNATLKGSPNKLLYTGGYAPACPGYSAAQGETAVMVSTCHCAVDV